MSLIKKPLVRSMRYAALGIITRGSILLARILPRSFGLHLFSMMGSLAFSLPHTDRTRTINHLRLIFGNQWDERTIRTTARSVYRELGKNIFDLFLLPRLPETLFNRIVTHDSLEPFLREHAKGKGCIMLTAHTGCFEMPLHFFASHGINSFAIGKKLKDDRFDNIIRKCRSGERIMYMDRSESPRKILRYIREGWIFGVLIDQDTSVEGVFADFLGRKAFTPSGPIKMAMKRDIPVFVITTARQPDNTHHVFINGPIALQQSNDFATDLVANVTLVNDCICRTIRQYPSQWVWMHRRWRRQPSPDMDLKR